MKRTALGRASENDGGSRPRADPHDYTAILRHAAARAVLAPSIHNTQPWRFVLAEDWLELRIDPMRHLRVLDPRSRQLVLSCGCALLNMRVAIAAAGHEAVVDRLPDPGRPDVLARVWVGDLVGLEALARLDPAIDERRTNRRAYADEPVPPVLLDRLTSVARDEGADLVPVASVEHRRDIAELFTIAEYVEDSDPAYLDELAAWTTDDPRRPDGVQAASVPYRGPDGYNADPIPIRPFDQRRMGWLPAASGSGTEECLLLLCTPDDSPLGWLRAGEALERVWLELTVDGFWASPLTAAVEVAATRDEMRRRLGLTSVPHLLLRVGRAPATVATRRRPLAEVLIDRSHAAPPADMPAAPEEVHPDE